MNYFEKRYGAGIEKKINIQCRMKTRRNKGRNKTRKGRNKGQKRRRTYKTRKYGGGKGDVPPLEFNKKPYDPKIRLDSDKFLNVERKIREEKLNNERIAKIMHERSKYLIKPEMFYYKLGSYHNYTEDIFDEKSFKDFLKMLNNDQIQDLYSTRYDMQNVIMFYRNYFNGRYLYKKDGTKMDTYKEFADSRHSSY